MAREDFPTMKEQTISLKGLRVFGTHGVLDHEHCEPQEFLIDAQMVLCVEEAVACDDVTATISYAAVADAIVQIVEGPHVDLIETLADRIAERIADMGARLVTVTVHKPNAPMPHEFETVSATATLPGALLKQQRRRIVIGVGSNLDVPEAHVIEAVSTLGEILEIEEVSELYRSAPRLEQGQEDQPDYVNAVVTCYTDMPLLPLLHLLHHIEADHGRVRTKRWEARTLDLDIIEVEGVMSCDPELLLPHPRAAERRFVLEPWLSIDPVAALGGTPVADMFANVEDQQVERMDIDEYMPRVIEAFQEWDSEGEFFDEAGFSGDSSGDGAADSDGDGLFGAKGHYIWGSFSGEGSRSGGRSSAGGGSRHGWGGSSGFTDESFYGDDPFGTGEGWR